MAIEIGTRLRGDVDLVSSRTGRPLPWGGRSLVATVLVATESPLPRGVRHYLERIAPARARCEKIGARFLVVAPQTGAGVGDDIDAIDAGGRLRKACRLEPSESGLLITDRWGEVYEILTPRSEKPWPDAKELEEWLYYVATQCPECGVLDVAGQDWSNVV